MDTLENSKESDMGIVAHIERLEQLCSAERSFGVEAEREILGIEELAQLDITHAEAELENCRMECEALRNRVQRACEGKEIIPNSLDSAPARADDGSQTNMAAAPNGPNPSISVSLSTSSYPVLGPPSPPLDMDAFSVISDLSDDPSILEEPPITNRCNHSVTQTTTNQTKNLDSIVERGISLCEARRSLQEEILKSIEKRENLYLDAVDSAKSSLALKRREAMDIATRLKDASGGIITIILPWQHEVKKEEYSTEKESPGPTPPPVALAPKPANTSFHPTCSAPAIGPSVLVKAPVIASPQPKPHKHQALLQRYEKKMNAAKGTKDTAIKVPSMPWPVLNPQFPLDLTDPSLSTTALQANLREFINSYSQWKQSTFKLTSKAMLSDWVLISGKLKKKNKGGKKMTDRVISHLRAFSK